MSHKIARFLLSDVTILRAILGGCAILFAFGLWFADSAGGAYESMTKHAPAWLWGIGFFTYGLAKFRLAFNVHSKLVSYCVVILGIYLWFFTILSFSNNPNRPMGSADCIMFLLVILEVWVGASTIAGVNDAGE